MDLFLIGYAVVTLVGVFWLFRGGLDLRFRLGVLIFFGPVAWFVAYLLTRRRSVSAQRPEHMDELTRAIEGTTSSRDRST